MRNCRFTTEIQGKVADEIRALAPGSKLTWSDVQAIAAAHGARVSRQWLCRSSTVAAAYRDAALARRSSRSPEGHPSVEAAAIAKLKAELRIQRETITASEKRLMRFVHNARLHGVNIGQLDAPIRFLEG